MTDDQARTDAAATDETQVAVPIPTSPEAAPQGAPEAVPSAPVEASPAPAAIDAPAVAAPVPAPAPAVVAAAPAAPAPAAPAPAPVIVPTDWQAGSTRKPRRRMGGLGQVVGIVGLVLSLVLVIGTVAGAMWLKDQVTAVETSVDAKLAQAQPALAQLTAVVTDAQAKVQELADLATQASSTATPPAGIAGTIREKLDALNQRYQDIRTGYADLKGKVMSAVGALETLSRLVPGVEIPQGPIDALNSLDAKLQELDTTVSDVLGTNLDGSGLQQVAGVIAGKVTTISDGLGKIVGVLDEANAKLAGARTQLAATADQVQQVITIAMIVGILLFLYLALLHWILFRTSRAVGRTG